MEGSRAYRIPKNGRQSATAITVHMEAADRDDIRVVRVNSWSVDGRRRSRYRPVTAYVVLAPQLALCITALASDGIFHLLIIRRVTHEDRTI